MTWRIVVEMDPSRTSLNQRLHWRERARRNAVVKLAAMCAWAHAGRPEASRRVRVSIVCRRGRALDADNVITGCKPALDALFAVRRRKGLPVEPGLMTPDDGPEWVELGEVWQETGARWRGRPEVEFIVEEVSSDGSVGSDGSDEGE